MSKAKADELPSTRKKKPSMRRSKSILDWLKELPKKYEEYRKRERHNKMLG